jgi:hypothetical protein
MMRIAAAALLLAAALGGLPVAAQETPTGAQGLQGSELIDHWLKAKWQELGLKAEARADDSEFVRRVHLDVIGTIPSLAETTQFLADKSPDKRRKLVESLLANEKYASNWAEQWAGTLMGYEADNRVDQARAGVKRHLEPVFAKNTPFDAVAREVMTASGATNQPTGMKMEEDAPDVNGTTVFYVRYQKTAGKDIAAAIAGKFSRTFLGTQIQCAQCHDHPFDTWTQEDFYGMAAFFTQLKIDRVKVDDKKEYYLVEDREPRKGRRTTEMQIPGTQTRVKIGFLKTKETPREGEGLREAFARMMTSRDNLQFARATVNRYWGHFFGRGFVNPVDEFNGRNKPSHPELIDAMAKDFIAHGFDLQHLIRSICNSQAYQVTSAGRKRDAETQKYFAMAAVRPLTPEQILHSLVTAMASDSAAGSLRRDAELVRALRDFRYAFGDDEGAEFVQFEGTIPGALLMMNSEIVARGSAAIKSKKAVTRLSEILASEKTPAERIRTIYLAVLSRLPSGSEQARSATYVAQHGGGNEAYEDVMWSLLNSSEFVLNH